MRRIRVIPTLLMKDGGLVKTTRFKKPVYVGDPINTLRIFNEKEVDELVLLNISANRHDAPIPLEVIQDIVSEAFMPIGFGGGIRSMQHIESLLKSGVEKVILNTVLPNGEALIREASGQFGAQSVVASLDVRKDWVGRHRFYTQSGTQKEGGTPVEWAKRLEDWGVGEIILNAIDRECTYQGYDLELIDSICSAVSIPVVASGGAGQVGDFRQARESGASAVAAGGMFVFQRPNQAVLITYPSQERLKKEVF